jgi:hypothetical protein
MKIVFENEDHELTFKDVTEDYFFVDSEGYLCQKCDDVSYVVIANFEGKPVSFIQYDVSKDRVIKRILPKVKNIEF